MAIDPSAPLLEVVRPALASDPPEETDVDPVVLGHGDVPDLAGVLVDVPKLDVASFRPTTR